MNLNYHMDKKVIGPEYVVNPPASPAHEAKIKDSLPAPLRQDLEVTRGKLGEPTEYRAGMVDPYGFSSYVDKSFIRAADSGNWLAWMQVVADHANAERRFFRSWIRLITAAKADDLRKRLKETTG